MEKYSLRPAQRSDASAIRRLIWQVGINPIGLDWKRFLVAVDRGGQVIGTGQIKIHSDGSQELASIAVCEEWRHRGVARAIIERLLSNHAGPLYLTCRSQLVPFYEKFGFQELEPGSMPQYFRRIQHLVSLFRGSGHLAIMMRK